MAWWNPITTVSNAASAGYHAVTHPVQTAQNAWNGTVKAANTVTTTAVNVTSGAINLADNATKTVGTGVVTLTHTVSDTYTQVSKTAMKAVETTKMIVDPTYVPDVYKTKIKTGATAAELNQMKADLKVGHTEIMGNLKTAQSIIVTTGKAVANFAAPGAGGVIIDSALEAQQANYKGPLGKIDTGLGGNALHAGESIVQGNLQEAGAHIGKTTIANIIDVAPVPGIGKAAGAAGKAVGGKLVSTLASAGASKLANMGAIALADSVGVNTLSDAGALVSGNKASGTAIAGISNGGAGALNLAWNSTESPGSSSVSFGNLANLLDGTTVKAAIDNVHKALTQAGVSAASQVETASAQSISDTQGVKRKRESREV